MIKFAFGCIVGVLAAWAYMAWAPSSAQNTLQGAGQSVSEMVEVARHDYCAKGFLAETKCYQSLPAKRCEEMIEQRCGSTAKGN